MSIKAIEKYVAIKNQHLDKYNKKWKAQSTCYGNISQTLNDYVNKCIVENML